MILTFLDDKMRRVLLDGEEIRFVTAFSTGRNGWVEYCETDKSGMLKIDESGGAVVRILRRGDVAIECADSSTPPR